MPETMDLVEEILIWLKERNAPPVTVLVVPGKPWSCTHIERLRELSNNGHELAAHGWHHHTTPRRIRHRIHAALISRNVAEHLDLDSAAILDLLERSKNWFIENKLPTPRLYVPPAWALGSISKEHLAKVPYHYIETTRGFLKKTEDRFRFTPFPLTGYEADTRFRETFLRFWNRHQEGRAKYKDTILRISIHPNDLNLRLTDQIDEQIRAISEFVNPDSI